MLNMKAEYLKDFDIILGRAVYYNPQMDEIIRRFVITYLDYFIPLTTNNPSAIIDKKIEQAMDLVKSHLLYTVREEVTVLKVRISELLKRISQLEIENNFLKANASPEILNALYNRPQQNSALMPVPAGGTSYGIPAYGGTAHGTTGYGSTAYGSGTYGGTSTK